MFVWNIDIPNKHTQQDIQTPTHTCKSVFIQDLVLDCCFDFIHLFIEHAVDSSYRISRRPSVCGSEGQAGSTAASEFECVAG